MTATRAAVAFMVRAMSSAEADDARGFHAGGGFELEQRDDGAGARGEHFALHAEVGEHAFELAAHGVQRLRIGLRDCAASAW